GRPGLAPACPSVVRHAKTRAPVRPRWSCSAAPGAACRRAVNPPKQSRCVSRFRLRRTVQDSAFELLAVHARPNATASGNLAECPRIYLKAVRRQSVDLGEAPAQQLQVDHGTSLDGLVPSTKERFPGLAHESAPP